MNFCVLWFFSQNQECYVLLNSLDDLMPG